MRARLARAVVYLALLAAAAATLFPLYFAFAGAVMAPGELASWPPPLVPAGLDAANLGAVADTVPLARQYLNSALVAGIVTLSQLVTSIMAAYALVFLPLRGARVVFAALLATLMVPWEALIIPNYLAISGWGLADTYAGLVLPVLASAFGVFMLRQSFLQFPGDLKDAARIDGVGHWRFLWRIVVPLNKPTVAAVGVYAFLTTWNQYFWPLIITRSKEMQTLQIGLSSLRDAEAADPGVLLAGVVLTLLPTLVLVVFGQRFLVRGLTAGSGR